MSRTCSVCTKPCYHDDSKTRSVWYWRMSTGIWMVQAIDGLDMDTNPTTNELETRVGGRSSRAAKKVALELAQKYGAEKVEKA